MHAPRCAHDMHVTKKLRATAAEYELLFSTNMLASMLTLKQKLFMLYCSDVLTLTWQDRRMRVNLDAILQGHD